MDSKVIEAIISDFICDNYGFSELEDPCYDLEKLSKEISSKLNDIEEEGWTPCSITMPDFGTKCLCTIKDGPNVIINQYGYKSYGKPVSAWANDSYEILAWQKLPEPYKE